MYIYIYRERERETHTNMYTQHRLHRAEEAHDLTIVRVGVYSLCIARQLRVDSRGRTAGALCVFTELRVEQDTAFVV